MNIGKRQQITDLTLIWPTEPKFSDWLASDDGLALIAEDLGINVEDARRESRPGDYPADIVGHALGDESHVIVIENQYGKTDHDHLGKLLTYAAMHSAMTGIWISQHISNDHRKVVDWLNDNTPPNISLYLAQLKAYRIGDSDVAPQLDIVSRPNLQVKIQRVESSSQTTKTQKWRQETWQDILEYIKDQNPPFSVQSPNDDHWSNIAIGRGGFWIGLRILPKNQRIGCELAMDVPWKQNAFNQLLTQQQEIEAEIGASLDWREMPENKSSRIIFEASIDPKSDTNRQAVREWMYKYAVAFHSTFQQRIKNLKQGVIPDKVLDSGSIVADDEEPGDNE